MVVKSIHTTLNNLQGTIKTIQIQNLNDQFENKSTLNARTY